MEHVKIENTSFEEDSSDDEPTENEFYFESDHLALRGDPDYAAVLRTIAILQAQRIQATKDIDRIAAAEKEALEEPELFLQRLTNGEPLNLPGSINVLELPKINFDKFGINVPDYPKESSENDSKLNDIKIRGRIFDQTKPETFNQLWTSEEQHRLEELLIEFPPEPIEMRRFAKIARALGNRTTKQVASRVQKFFKKLCSAGMPIPGRLPKNHRDYKNMKSLRPLYRTSTFFPAQDVPVVMPEDDDLTGGASLDFFHRKGTASNSFIVDQEASDDETVPADNKEIRMVKLMQRIRNDKERYKKSNRLNSQHLGFKCDICTEEPVLGTRWHCVTCTQLSVDFCSDCIITQMLDSKKCHPITHRFIGLRVVNQAESTSISKTNTDVESDSDDEFYEKSTNRQPGETQQNLYDKDYLPQKFSQSDDYNYLDPNFLPE